MTFFFHGFYLEVLVQFHIPSKTHVGHSVYCILLTLKISVEKQIVFHLASSLEICIQFQET